MSVVDYNVAEYRQGLIEAFGASLAQDVSFKLTSPATYDYNCIAFAMGVDDRWVDCADMPWHWWPQSLARDRTPDGLVAAFGFLGFETCGLDDSMEAGFEKVALYAKNDEWTHAARVVDPGVYHSKFGASFDGRHSGGDVLAAQYGHVYQIMRRTKSIAETARAKLGIPPGVVHLQKKICIDGYEDHLVLFKGHIHLANHGNEVVLLSDGRVKVIS